MLYMPEKKPNALSQLFSVFQRKKYVYDDIVVTADKVIEDYIFYKNKLLRKAYPKKSNKPFFWCGAILVTVITAIVLIT